MFVWCMWIFRNKWWWCRVCDRGREKGGNSFGAIWCEGNMRLIYGFELNSRRSFSSLCAIHNNLCKLPNVSDGCREEITMYMTKILIDSLLSTTDWKKKLLRITKLLRSSFAPSFPCRHQQKIWHHTTSCRREKKWSELFSYSMCSGFYDIGMNIRNSLS